jgi:hypothetical protein
MIPVAARIHRTRAGERVLQPYRSTGRKGEAAACRTKVQSPKSNQELEP